MKIIKSGKATAQQDYEATCGDCDCEFTAEKGDKFKLIQLTNPRRIRGTITHYETHIQGGCRCPECDAYVHVIIGFWQHPKEEPGDPPFEVNGYVWKR